VAKLKAGGHIEILITDINMPGLGGFDLAEIAKRLRPGLQVILLSGIEVDGHDMPLIRKPFRERDLARVMSRATGLC
jgi:FixJ family two-component response regulator